MWYQVIDYTKMYASYRNQSLLHVQCQGWEVFGESNILMQFRARKQNKTTC